MNRRTTRAQTDGDAPPQAQPRRVKSDKTGGAGAAQSAEKAGEQTAPPPA